MMAKDDSDAEIKVCLKALLDCMNDKADQVNDAIHRSLCKIATGEKVNIVLTTCCEYRKSKKKLDNEHVANIFRAMEQMCMQQGEALDADGIQFIIEIVIKEMISNNDYIPNIQMPASGILVAIGNFHCLKVVEPLTELLKPGVIPHYTIPHTLGTLSATNINGTVPLIKSILGKMLPTLGMLKMDPLKQAFAYALGHFSTALIDYLGNNENNELSLVKENFSTEISIAFDVMCIHWIHCGEGKVVENVMEAMGSMFCLLPPDKMKDLIPKLIPTVLSLYKKTNVDSYYITQSLTLILVEFIKNKNTFPTPLIESIIQSMFTLIITSPDYDQPQKIKNHFELLRCFDILVTNFPDCSLEYIFQQVKNNNEEERMKAIVVLTHLVTSSEFTVKKMVDRFITMLRVMIIHENNIKMKGILLKAIVALAYRQHLTQKEDLVLLEFIIKQCSNNKMNDPAYIEKNDMDDLINDCENSLYLLSSTVPDIKPYLWPLLVKALLECDYSKGIAIITRCLTQLAKIKLFQEDIVDQSNELLVPSNESVYVRCMSLLINHAEHKVAHNVILFLLSYCENIHKELKVSWEIDLQKLLSFLESKEFTIDAWESMILDLFRSAIYLSNEHSWIEVVSHKILEQIPKSEKFISQKGMLFKFLAILLCHVVDVNSVGFRLDVLFNALHNSSPEESQHLARALGIASIRHGSCIVDKLDLLTKELDAKKSSRFLNFNFMKNSKHDNISNMRYSITLCYGEVAKEVLDENVLLKLVSTDNEKCGGSIRWTAAQLRLTNPSILLSQASLNTVHLLASAIRSVPQANIILQDKWNLLNLVLDQMFEQTSNDSNIELFPSIIKATTSLILLPKFLAPEERNVVLRTICSKVYNSVRFLKTTFSSIEEEKSNDLFAKLLNDTLFSLNGLIKEFMVQSTCPSTLDDILSILDEWIANENEEVRVAAMRSVHVTLIYFIQHVKLTYENPSRFGQTGLIMGKMVPRCSDVNNLVRDIAIDSIKILVQIVDLYEGRATDESSDIMKNLSNIQADIATDDPEKLALLISHLADIISNKVPHQQTIQLIESLLNGLHSDEDSALGCNKVLDIIFKNKGQDLYQNVNDVMEYIFLSLNSVEGNVRSTLLGTILTLTKYHPKAMVSCLLLQPLPFERSINDCWRTLAKDNSIANLLTDQLMNILTSESLFEESIKYDSERVVSVQSLAAISGLNEMLSQSEVHAICVEKFSEVFSMLYTMLACMVGAVPPAHSAVAANRSEKFGFIPNAQVTKLSPAKITMDTLKAFLVNAGCEKAAECCWQSSELASGDHLNSFLNMVPSMVETFSVVYPQYLPKLVLSLNQYAHATLIPQRIAVVVFFSNLVIFRCNDQAVLLETVLATLNSGWKDTALDVRAISLGGLTNIKYLKEEQRDQHMTAVITALYSGLDDYQGSTSRTNVPLVAMVGFSDLLPKIDLNSKSMDSFPPVSQRIKSFFNTETSVLREASVLLFGELIVAQSSDALREQALSLFPCFLLHLADEDIKVVRACKQTLKKISPIFGAEKTNSMIQNHLIDGAKLHLIDFIKDLIQTVCGELPKFIPQFIENTSNYLNSPWDNIRANAAIAIGVLFSCYDSVDEDYETNKKHLVPRLLQLMKDQNPKVRSCTATALSSVYVGSSYKKTTT